MSGSKNPSPRPGQSSAQQSGAQPASPQPPGASTRPFVCAANWKMHKSPREALEFTRAFAASAARDLSPSRKAILFVPTIDLWVVQEALRGSSVGWGAQNCHWEMKGAFTGETSPAVLAEILTPYCLVGHSERRTLFGETDEQTGKKVTALHSVGIVPMLCVGETLAERSAGKAREVVKRQLEAGLALRDADLSVIVAYEPVWAIGTGQVASPAQAAEMHAFARETLAALGGPDFAEATPILYGGSVKPDNAPELRSQPGIDGFLVGGASLEAASFAALCLA